jgi:hypothetical protein
MISGRPGTTLDGRGEDVEHLRGDAPAVTSSVRASVLAVALVACALMLACTGAASASLGVGVNDNAGKVSTMSSWFYSTMPFEGLRLNAITERWDDTQPTMVPDVASVNDALAKARANGVNVVLDLYPLHSQVFTSGQRCTPSGDPNGCGDTAEIAAWAAWVARVATTFPGVHEFVVMNECNQPLFVNPQFDSSGENQSAAICGRALAAAYDALKQASPSNFVWGVGLSPRGNDLPNALSNSSTSPVKFVGDLGAWFRSFAAATGRTAPLMDGFDFHPYPIPQSLPFATGYSSPNDASVANLPRIYQAFYSAFAGTSQRTIGQQAGGGLPVSLNEVGIQTDETGLKGTSIVAAAVGRIRIFDGSTHSLRRVLAPFGPGYTRPLSVALGDVNGDGVADIAVGGGKGGPPVVKLLNGKTGKLIVSHTPFPGSLRGGVSVALGDLNGDKKVDLIVGSGPGTASQVKVFSGATNTVLESLRPFAPSFTGGVTVAAGDLSGDGSADLIVGTGPGIASEVDVFSGATSTLLESLQPFTASFTGGVTLAAGDLRGSGEADLIVGSGAGNTPVVRVFEHDTGTQLGSFDAFASTFAGGTEVSAGDVSGDSRADLIVGAGTGGGALVRIFDATKHTLTGYFLGAPGSSAIAVAAGS